MSDVDLSESKRAWSDEPLILGRLSGKILRNKSGLINDSLPGLLSPFTSLNNREHLSLAHSLNLSNGNRPLSSLLLSLLLDHIRENFTSPLILSVHKESRNWLGVLLGTFSLNVLLLMSLNLLVHLDLLLVPLFVEYLSFDSPQFLGLL